MNQLHATSSRRPAKSVGPWALSVAVGSARPLLPLPALPTAAIRQPAVPMPSRPAGRPVGPRACVAALRSGPRPAPLGLPQPSGTALMPPRPPRRRPVASIPAGQPAGPARRAGFALLSC